MKGVFLTVAKDISELGRPTRFGPNWPGKRCLAKTRRGTPCQRPAFKHNGTIAVTIIAGTGKWAALTGAKFQGKTRHSLDGGAVYDFTAVN